MVVDVPDIVHRLAELRNWEFVSRLFSLLWVVHQQGMAIYAKRKQA